MLSPLQLGAQHVEDVLSSVSEQTARLAAAVTNIGAALEQRATRDDVRAASQAQAGEVAALAKRLAALESAVTVGDAGGGGGEFARNFVGGGKSCRSFAIARVRLLSASSRAFRLIMILCLYCPFDVLCVCTSISFPPFSPFPFLQLPFLQRRRQRR